MKKDSFAVKLSHMEYPKIIFGEKLMSEIFSNVQIILSLRKKSFKPPTAVSGFVISCFERSKQCGL